MTAGSGAAPIIVLSRRRKIVFACIACLMAAGSTMACLLVLDIYLRHRIQSFGLNAWGYRGPSVGRKKAGETRIGTLGGSTFFAYGLSWSEAGPRNLELQINVGRRGRVPATVVNLGMPRDSAATFVATIG